MTDSQNQAQPQHNPKPATTTKRKRKKKSLLGDVAERQLLELKELLREVLEEGASLPPQIRKLLEEAESLSWVEFSKLHMGQS